MAQISCRHGARGFGFAYFHGAGARALARLSALLLAVGALGLLAPAGSAVAAEITFVSAVGSWRDPVDNVPGSQPGDPVITNGDPTSSISWGDTTGSQSGYDFTATLPPPFTLPGPIPFFSLGSFTHRNFEVGDPSLTSVELDVELVLAVDGVPTGPLTFSFTFNHEETPNNQTPCPYPTPPGEGCTDRVTIVASAEPTTFNVDGVDYTLAMSFLDNGSAVDEFITREGGTINSSGLVGDFTLPPGLSVAKSGPASLRLAEWGEFAVNVHNASEADAFNVTLVDRLPDGMCDTTPEVLSARVYAADGVSPVPGKGPLVEGTDYSLAYDGAACVLTMNTLTAASVIGVDERLVISYRTRLDTDAQDGVTLTNVAGATRWYNDDAANPDRTTYARTLTDGTVGIGDHEDAHTVTVDLPVLRFEKRVVNVTTGEDPATVATPGDTLRYRLYVENLSDVTVSDFRIVDELDSLNDPPAFQAGTLNLIAAPAGADTANTDATGGAAGTGLLDIGNLDIGGLGETVLIEYEVALAPALADERLIYNQAELSTDGIPIAVSDDPNVNGQADPAVADDDDPTRVQIESAPYFDVDKISSYVTGDPAVLLAGETLRYTITVRNVGTDHATDTVLRDQVPANTTYVAGSTTLNGNPVADAAAGQSPLIAGIPIHAPEDPTPGAMRADATETADNVATIVFDVVVNPDAPDGTVIANQAFVSAPDGGVVDRPSDDPRTPLVDDPTRDVVGNVPLLFAAKSAALELDYGTPDIVDPGDVLRYRITIYNDGAVPATEVALVDEVPLYTTYVADSTTLNGLAVGQPDAGVSPLAAGIPVSSSDLTPPLPGMDAGTLTPGQSAVVEFLLRVDDDTETGSVISNQAEVTSYERPTLLTDGDGDPATGPEPTLVVVGPAQVLDISKQVAVVGGGPALAGAQLEYIVRVRNIGSLPALDVRIVDDLDEPTPAQLLFDGEPPTVNGGSAGVTVDGSVLTVEYGDLAPEGEIVVRFLARIYDDLPVGTRVINTASAYWNDTQRVDASVAIDVGAIVGVGALNGHVWHDADFDDQLGAAERPLEGWRVELYRNGQLTTTALTDAEGAWQMAGLTPNYLTEDTLALEFVAPGAGAASAKLGRAYSADFSNALQRISDIVIQPGSNLVNLDLPIDPNGVVYDSVTRAPLAGVTLTLTEAGSGAPLPAACFDDPAQQGQVTRSDGFYKFDLNFADPACASGGAFSVQVVEPSGGYTAGYSEIIPPVDDGTTFDVPGCPLSVDDAVAATDGHCEVQVSELAPGTAVAAQSTGTRYYVYRLRLDDTDQPGSAQIFNNHIPVDPVLEGAVAITKTTPMVNVNRGQMVPYTITVANTYPIALQDVGVIDAFPPGFRYVEDSARVDGVPLEPTVGDRELLWEGISLPAEGQRSIELLLAVGAGVTEGEFVNRARAINSAAGIPLSGEATATVRLVPDPTFDCTDVMGKVFDDDNRNGAQDRGEAGLAGVRLVTPRGLAATTDQHGRFHITCAITPREDRGSNFVLKLDDRTLPSGFRMSSDTVQIKRATRGKALRFNFGASIHRVIGLEVADAVFEPGSSDIRPLWRDRFDLLLEELQKAPAVLRLTYLAELEPPGLVDRRLEVMRREIAGRWRALDCCYRLEIEHDVFWRLGAPAEDAVSDRGRARP